MADKRSIEEILNDDPFDVDEPTERELYLHAALKLAFANVRGLTHALELIDARLDEHERAHAAASMAALNLPDSPIKDDKPN